jgi:integrase
MGVITDNDLGTKPDSTKWLSDPAAKGAGRFMARLKPGGGCQFYFRYTNSSGKREFLPLGTYDARGTKGLTLKQARMQAGDYSRLHQSGIKDLIEHLAALRAAEAAQIVAGRAAAEAETARLAAEQAAIEVESKRLEARRTVCTAFEYWNEIKLSTRKDGGAATRRMFNVDVLPIIGDKYIDELTRSDVLDVIDRIQKRGANEQARETFTCLRQLCRFAYAREWIDKEPTAVLSKSDLFGKKEERERILSEDEIKQLSHMLPNAGLLVTSQLAVWIALSTTCRIGNLMEARWENVDIDKGIWFLPDTKNGKPFTIFLSDFTKQQLKTLKTISGTSAWCYPNRSGADHVCEKSATKQIMDRQLIGDKAPMTNRTKHKDALNLPGGKWTMHDLRRSGASLMTKLGVLDVVADKCLAHTEENKVKRIYLRHDYKDEMREAWRLLGERLDLLTSPETSNVVPLGGRSRSRD